MPQMAGAAAVARRSRRMPASASAPALPGVASPSKPPTPPPAFGEKPRRRSFGTSEACLAASDEKAQSSPVLTPKSKKSPPESQNSTPRTPRSVEVRVEGQELLVPGGVWASGGHIELAVQPEEHICAVTVKTGLTGRGGLNVVLRVGLDLQGIPDNTLRFPSTVDSLTTWTKVQVAGVEECDMGRLPCRQGSLPKAPHPGSCRHEWSDSGTSGYPTPRRCGEVSAQEALLLGPSGVSCSEFYCGLSLDVRASCAVTAQGQAKLRVEVHGELRLLPRFFPAGREGVARLYKAARDSFCGGDDLKALQSCEEAVTMADALVPRPREMGDVLNLMGAIHLRRQSPTVAVKCLERALLVREQTAGSEEDPGIAATLNTLGSAHQALGAHGEARRCHERACVILKAGAGSSPSPNVASCLQSLGGVHRAMAVLAMQESASRKRWQSESRCWHPMIHSPRGH